MQVGVRELREHLSVYLDLVRRGEELVVTVRGRAVARLVPMDFQSALDGPVSPRTGHASAATPCRQSATHPHQGDCVGSGRQPATVTAGLEPSALAPLLVAEKRSRRAGSTVGRSLLALGAGQPRRAVTVISTLPLRALDTGQPSLASSAAVANPSSSSPGTAPTTSSAMETIRHSPST